jgi:hypothetical protein
MAENCEETGISMSTEGVGSFFFGQPCEWEFKGHNITNVHGCYFQHIGGWQQELTVGFKDEVLLGAFLEWCFLYKWEWMKGWRTIWLTKGERKKVAEEIGRINARFEEVVKYEVKKVKGVLENDIETFKQTINNQVTEIKKESIWTIGALACEVHDVMNLEAGGNATLESKKGNLNLKAKSNMDFTASTYSFKGKSVKFLRGVLKMKA